jgi:hypothetical protein
MQELTGKVAVEPTLAESESAVLPLDDFPPVRTVSDDGDDALYRIGRTPRTTSTCDVLRACRIL